MNTTVMNTTFFAIWAVLLVADGILTQFLVWAAHSERYAKYRIRNGANRITPKRKAINTNLNNIFSLCIFAGYFYYLGGSTLYAGTPRVVTLLGEVLGSLMLYDFMYYFLHRTMHHPKLMKYVHGIHHFVRNPVADESTYLHPAETFAGVGLLLLAVYILGPISTTSFLITFFIYSTANIIVHSNLVFPHPALRLFNFWVVKHDVHHNKLRDNYASLFPFWDQAFGTAK
jgi:sterol desaturase/sphingolipid hydroxylase (fatty acid hydroxylase superfamily)